MLPQLQSLPETSLQYPVLFQRNQGCPKKEVQLTKPYVGIQKCSLCKWQGLYIYVFLFYESISLGHNKKKCVLSSSQQILPAEPPKKVAKKARASSSKCQMLAHLGIDYLNQFAKKFDLKINSYLSGANEEEIISLIEKVLSDPTKTKAIEISIVFYLLNLQELSPSEKCAKVLQQLLDSTGIMPNVKWVSF